MVERLDKMDTFSPGEAFKYGIFKIMPIIADHSAFDASSFKIEAGGVKVFHTGDFRLNGFRSGNYDKVLNKYIGKVDYVVCEGTNAAYPDVTNTKESELQQQFYQEFCEHKGNVVYLSSSNIDRLFSIYHAAKRAGRPFLVDHYQKRVMDAIVEKDHIWGKSSLYQYGRFKPYDNVDHFENNPKLKNLLEDKGYVLIARATDRFDSLIKRLPGEKQKYLSMWRGYLKEGHEAYNEKLAKALEDGYLYRHTSGHCDMKSLHEFFALLSPKAIIPIHTNNPDGFTKYFNDEWPIIRLHDGELRTLSQNVSQL